MVGFAVLKSVIDAAFAAAESFSVILTDDVEVSTCRQRLISRGEIEPLARGAAQR